MSERKPDQFAEQDHGARWPIFFDYSTEGDLLVLTGAGRELYDGSQRGEAEMLIRMYRAAETGKVAFSDIRRKLGEGQQAAVYSMGPYAVREERAIKGDYAAIGELQRMATINTVIEHGLPRWLHVPKHYAIHVDPSRQKTYTLMDRIDSGVTAEDIINYPDVSPDKTRTIEAVIADDIENAKQRVPGLYDRAYEILAGALEEAHENPELVLNDWAPRNVLVERLPYPVAGENYSLNVIDQHKT